LIFVECYAFNTVKQPVRYVGRNNDSSNVFNDSSAVANARFYVIVGSYAEMNEAIKNQEQLIKKGYPAIILPAKNGKYRISLDSFSFRKNAEIMKDKYAKENPTAKPWILAK
jgi:cell division protein FtsN